MISKIIAKYFFIIFQNLFIHFSFKNYLRDFNADFLCLGSGSSSGFGANSGSGSRFFNGTNLFLKLLRTFCLAEKNNSMLLKNNFFSIDFTPLTIFFHLLANLLCSSSAFFNDKYPSCISFEKIIAKKYSIKL